MAGTRAGKALLALRIPLKRQDGPATTPALDEPQAEGCGLGVAWRSQPLVQARRLPKRRTDRGGPRSTRRPGGIIAGACAGFAVPDVAPRSIN